MADQFLKLNITGDSGSAQAAVNDVRTAVANAAAQTNTINQQVASFSNQSLIGVTRLAIGLDELSKGSAIGVLNAIRGFTQLENSVKVATSATANLKSTLGLLDASFASSGVAKTGADTFARFQKALNSAAVDGGKTAEVFKELGVSIETGLVKPATAFQQFLTNVSKIEDAGRRQALVYEILGTNSKDFTKALTAAGESMAQFSGSSVTATTGLGRLAAAMGPVGIAAGLTAIAAVAAGVAIVKFAGDAASTAEEIQKLVDETALAPVAMRRLQVASEIVGGSIDTVISSFRKFRTEVTDARLGEEDLAEKLQSLGVIAKKAGADSLDSFAQLVATIQNLTNEGTKAKAAQDLLGLSLSQLAEIDRTLTNDHGKVKDAVAQTGSSMSGEALEAAKKYREEAAKLKVAWDEFANEIGGNVIPVLTSLIKLLGQFKTTSTDFVPFKDGVRPLTDAEKAARNAGNAVQDLGTKLKIAQGVEVDFGNAVNIETGKLQAEYDKRTKAYEDYLRKKNAGQQKERDTSSALLRAQIKDLQLALADELRTYDEFIQSNTLLFNEKLITESAYSSQLEALYQTRLAAIRTAAAQERAAIAASSAPATAKISEIERVKQQEEQAQRTLYEDLFKLQQEAGKRSIEAERTLIQERVRQNEVLGQTEIDLIQSQMDRKVLSQEQGDQRIAAINQKALQDRIDVLQREAAVLAGDPTDTRYRVLVAQIQTLQDQLAQAQQAGLIKIQKARLEDLANFRQYSTSLRTIQDQIAQAQIDYLATFSGKDQAVIAARAELQRQQLIAESNDRIAVLQLELAETKVLETDSEAVRQTKIKREKALTDQITAELEARAAKIQLINRKAAVDAESAASNSNRNLLGGTTADALALADALSNAFGIPLTEIDKFRIGLDAWVQDLQQKLPTATQLFQLSFRQMAQATSQSLSAFLTGKATIGQAVQGIIDAALEPYKQYAELKATIEYAEAASSFAIGDFGGGAKHLGAALLWTGLAGLLGAVGTLVTGQGGQAGAGSSSTPTLSGTRQDKNAISTTDLIRFRESGALQPVTTIVIKHENGMFVSQVETALVSSYRSDGSVRKIIDNATTGRPI